MGGSRSSDKVAGVMAFTPLQSAVTATGTMVEELIKERGDLLKDYDSFQRRLKVVQEKKDPVIGKPSEADAAGTSLLDCQSYSVHSRPSPLIVAEVTKYETKVQKGKEAYETANTNCKAEIIASHRAHDALVDTELLTILVCQVGSLFLLSVSLSLSLSLSLCLSLSLSLSVPLSLSLFVLLSTTLSPLHFSTGKTI
jgi:hypothetical protein